MSNWFRVPTGIARSLTGDRKARREEAVVDLLGRWHIGNEPTVRELMRAWDWSGERVSKLMAEMFAWAEANDAARPGSLPTRPNKIGQQPDSNRTATGHVEAAPTPVVDPSSDSDRTATGQRPDTSCAGALLLRETRDERETEDTPKPPAEPPARLAPVEPEPGAPKPTTPELVTVPVEPGVPRWTPPVRECNGHPRSAVATAVLRCIEAVRQSPATADNTATDAKAVLALWRALGRPDPASFAGEFILVTTWAQQSPDPMAARNLRGEGWDGGVYRARAVDTLTRQKPWGDRLDAARAWDRAGRPTTATGPPNARGSPVESDDEHNARVEAERFRMFGPLPRQPNHPGP